MTEILPSTAVTGGAAPGARRGAEALSSPTSTGFARLLGAELGSEVSPAASAPDGAATATDVRPPAPRCRPPAGSPAAVRTVDTGKLAARDRAEEAALTVETGDDGEIERTALAMPVEAGHDAVDDIAVADEIDPLITPAHLVKVMADSHVQRGHRPETGAEGMEQYAPSTSDDTPREDDSDAQVDTLLAMPSFTVMPDVTPRATPPTSVATAMISAIHGDAPRVDAADGPTPTLPTQRASGVPPMPGFEDAIPSTAPLSLAAEPSANAQSVAHSAPAARPQVPPANTASAHGDTATDVSEPPRPMRSEALLPAQVIEVPAANAHRPSDAPATVRKPDAAPTKTAQPMTPVSRGSSAPMAASTSTRSPYEALLPAQVIEVPAANAHRPSDAPATVRKPDAAPTKTAQPMTPVSRGSSAPMAASTSTRSPYAALSALVSRLFPIASARRDTANSMRHTVQTVDDAARSSASLSEVTTTPESRVATDLSGKTPPPRDGELSNPGSQRTAVTAPVTRAAEAAVDDVSLSSSPRPEVSTATAASRRAEELHGEARNLAHADLHETASPQTPAPKRTAGATTPTAAALLDAGAPQDAAYLRRDGWQDEAVDIAPGPSFDASSPVAAQPVASTTTAGDALSAPMTLADAPTRAGVLTLDISASAWHDQLRELLAQRLASTSANLADGRSLVLQLQPRAMGAVTLSLSLNASQAIELRLSATSERTRRFFAREAGFIAASFARGGLNVSRIRIADTQDFM